MSILNNYKKEKDIEVASTSYTIPSGVYAAQIDVAYLIESKNGAKGIVLEMSLSNNGKAHKHQETVYFTNRAGEIFYTKNDTKCYLPGYILMDNLAYIATGEDLSEQETETKTLKVYSSEAKKEVPTEVEVLTGLVDEVIDVALQEKREYKQQLIGGKYQPINQEVMRNYVQDFYNDDGFSANEVRNEEEEAVAQEKWLARNDGKLYDACVGVTPLSSSDTTKDVAGDAKPTKSLFTKKGK